MRERGVEIVPLVPKSLKSQIEQGEQNKQGPGATARQINQHGIEEKEFHDFIIKQDGSKKADLVTFSSYSRGQTL